MEFTVNNDVLMILYLGVMGGVVIVMLRALRERWDKQLKDRGRRENKDSH